MFGQVNQYLVSEEKTYAHRFIFKLPNGYTLLVKKLYSDKRFGIYHVIDGYKEEVIDTFIDKYRITDIIKEFLKYNTKNWSRWSYNPQILVCDCGRIAITIDDEGNFYCYDCYDELKTCEDCGHVGHEDNFFYVDTDGYYVCEDCYNDSYISCEYCGEVRYQDDMRYSERDGCYYCPNCYEEEEEDDCDNDDNGEGIYGLFGHYYTPTPLKFIGDNKRYYGVELEVEYKKDDTIDITDFVSHRHFYCKYDSSLNNGCEIVTHPMNLDYHLDEWTDILRILRRNGFNSHNNGNCGLHIHVNRNSLGDTIDERDELISKLILFTEITLDNGLYDFSRRKDLNWCENIGYNKEMDTIDDLYDKAKNESSDDEGRYKIVNLCNRNTIEFRLLRGTLNELSFKSGLKLFDYILSYCESHEIDEIEDMTFKEFVYCYTDTDIISYVEKRNLFTTN